MADSSKSASGGIGFFGLLTVLFIGLKLTHYIDWSWPWVIAPLWVPMVIFAVGVCVVILIWFFWWLLKTIVSK